MAFEKILEIKILFLFVHVFTLCIASSIPVITWWHGTGINVPSKSSNILSGHSIKPLEVLKNTRPIYEESKLIIMFLQDKLSVDDFTKYSDSFPFIQQQLEEEKQLVFPSVSYEDVSLYESLRSDSNYRVVEVFPETDWLSQLSRENLANNKVNVFVLHLEPVIDVDSSAKNLIFKRNDATMNSVVKNILNIVPDAAFIYTASEPSKDVAKVFLNEHLDDNSLNSRHLLATQSNETGTGQTVFNTTNVLIALSSLSFGTDQKMKKFNASELDLSSEKENVTLLTIRVGNNSLDIKINFTKNNLEWSCQSIEVTGKFNNTNVDVQYECGETSTDPFRQFNMTENNVIAVPLQYSFSCYKLLFTAQGKNKGNYTGIVYHLEMDDVQIELGAKKFSDAYSCVGFFSIPILTSLLVGLILIASLFMGTMMMLNIKTQDRFDDPKGKTITVHAGE